MQALSRVADVSSRPLRDFLSEQVIVEGQQSVSEIVGKLVYKRLQEVFVQRDSKFGVVTIRSILRAGEMSGRKLSTLAVTPPPMTLNDPVSKAAKVMSDLRIRSLPVTDPKGKMKGGVSTTTILQELSRIGTSGVSVSIIMTPRPITIDFSDSMDKARSLMVEHDIDHLPVTRDGELAGLITSLQIVGLMGATERVGRTSRLSEPSSRGTVEAGGVMKDEPIICKPTEDSILVLGKIMEKGGTGAIVVSGEAVRGIVTLRDYMKVLTVQPESPGPPVYVVGLPEHDIESSRAELKFQRSIEALGQVYPGIIEARATVKSSSLEKERRRFEAHVLIRMPREQFDLTEEGWSIGEVFEKVGAKIKRLMTKPRYRSSHRNFPSRREIESARFSE